MKLWILVVLTVICLQLVSSKTTEKSNRKKVAHLKKKIEKPSKSNVEAFRDLPPEDLAFIKELDKQFKDHGDNVKIKVERINGTTKNSKRTIDGELGYGYHNQQFSSGYQFSQPKFMIYPYSQHDIPTSVGNYRNTIVSIQPSQAFELKEEPVNYQHQGQYEQSDSGYMPYQPVDQYYAEPVIVLRIPGPHKYASHLQALLQQYLEIRAAQYLRALQESEAQYQHTNSYEPQYQAEPQTPSHGQDIYQQHQPIEQVYQSYQYQQQPNAQQQQQQHQQQQHYQVTYENQDANVPGHDQSGTDEEENYEYNRGSQKSVNKYSSSSYHYRTPVYDYSTQHARSEPHSVYGPATYSSHDSYSDDKSYLPISENYPSHTHTKVVFTDGENKDHSTSYPLPTVSRAQKYHTPRPEYDYEDSNYDEGQSSMSIKPRPFNYHPHNISKGLKRNIPNTQEEQFRKLNKLISRLKKKSEPIQPSEVE